MSQVRQIEAGWISGMGFGALNRPEGRLPYEIRMRRSVRQGIGDITTGYSGRININIGGHFGPSFIAHSCRHPTQWDPPERTSVRGSATTHCPEQRRTSCRRAGTVPIRFHVTLIRRSPAGACHTPWSRTSNLSFSICSIADKCKYFCQLANIAVSCSCFAAPNHGKSRVGCV